MRYFTFALLFICPILGHSQNYEWSHSFEGTSLDEIIAVTTDPIDKSIYLTGHFFESFDGIPGTGNSMTDAVGAFDLFLIKLDEDGDFLWMNVVGGLAYDQGMELIVDAQQNIILLAREEPKTSVFKYSQAGSFVWYYTSDYTSTSSPKSIATDSEGNIYVTGTYSDTVDFDNSPSTENLIAEGNEDAYILKLDSDGEYVWSKSIGSSTGGALGRCIEISDQDEIVLSGFFYGTVNFDPNSGTSELTGFGSSDNYTAKLDTAGNLLWVNQTGGTQSNQVGDIVLDPEGNIYSVGHFDGSIDADPSVGAEFLHSNAASDVYIQKLDLDGNFIWAQSFGGSGYDVPQAICIDPTGDLYITGKFNGVVDFDNSSNENTLETDISDDTFILKISEDGDFHWARQIIGEAAFNSGNDIAVDNQNDILVVGSYNGTADFNPGPAESLMTSLESTDGYLVKLNQDASKLEENNSTELSFYPNPSSGHIQTNQNINRTFKLYSTDGRLIETVNSIDGKIDLSHNAKGTYILISEYKDKFFKSSKVVIE